MKKLMLLMVIGMMTVTSMVVMAGCKSAERVIAVSMVRWNRTDGMARRFPCAYVWTAGCCPCRLSCHQGRQV